MNIYTNIYIDWISTFLLRRQYLPIDTDRYLRRLDIHSICRKDIYCAVIRRKCTVLQPGSCPGGGVTWCGTALVTPPRVLAIVLTTSRYTSTHEED